MKIVGLVETVLDSAVAERKLVVAELDSAVEPGVEHLQVDSGEYVSEDELGHYLLAVEELQPVPAVLVPRGDFAADSDVEEADIGKIWIDESTASVEYLH